MTEKELNNLSDSEVMQLIRAAELSAVKQIENEFNRLPFLIIALPVVREYLKECSVSGLRSLALLEKKLILNKILSETINNTLKITEISVRKCYSLGGVLCEAQIKKRYPNACNLKSFDKTNIEKYLTKKTNGLKLSDRVWKLQNGMLEQIEATLQLGILEGKSANDIALDLRKYLKDPDMLFRRVRNEEGKLKLSRAAKNYHPGQGVYRSSYKNAHRLALNEINKVYRLAQWERWQDIDFIVGFEVKRSNNKYYCPVCESLKGVYPKDFKFSGWHVRCSCVIIPKLADMKLFLEHQQRLIDGENSKGYKYKDEVKKMPDNFLKWVRENKHRYKPNTVDWIEQNPIIKEMFKSK